MKLDLFKVYSIINSNSNLKNFYNWYISHCVSMTLPYHNIRHTLGVMYHIISIYEYSHTNGDCGFVLEDKDLYILLTSALFHDYNHSGGRFNDDINVYNAKNGLRECLYTYLEDDEQTRIVVEECEKVIDATQYPYIISDNDLNLYQLIIRECDILVCLYDDYYTHRVFGLMEEMKTGDNHKMFLAKEAKFIFDSVKKFRLTYSIDVWKENSTEFMNLLELMTNIIC